MSVLANKRNSPITPNCFLFKPRKYKAYARVKATEANTELALRNTQDGDLARPSSTN
jgi:hypothetical protein